MTHGELQVLSEIKVPGSLQLKEVTSVTLHVRI